MRNSLPCVAALPPVMQAPVKVSLLSQGLVKPSVSVRRKITIWSSSLSVRPRLPTVMSMLLATSGMGQQSTFSVVPFGQWPRVAPRKRYAAAGAVNLDLLMNRMSCSTRKRGRRLESRVGRQLSPPARPRGASRP
jgi:hypothetical protein